MTRTEMVTSKREALLEALNNGSEVLLMVSPHVPGVVLPEHFYEQALVPLSIAYGYNLPWLVTDRDDALLVCLKFGATHYSCELPWGAIVGMKVGDRVLNWQIETSHWETPIKDEDGVHVVELPRTALSIVAAHKLLTILAAHLASNFESAGDKVRFSLAPLDRSAYTGLKLVVDNTRLAPSAAAAPPEPEPENVA